MKSIKVVLVLTFLFSIYSCSIIKKVEKSIVGKWDIILLHAATDNIENISENEMFKELLKGSYIEFKSDKSYELNLMGKKINDTWSISEDGSKILSSKADNFFEIVNKTDNGMILNSIDGKSKLVIKLKRS